jgi:predicted DNA-binding transcriptional regulator AlpA
MTPRLVGVREIAKLLSVSRQRADQLVRTKGFPEPAAELASGRVWPRSSVVRWAKQDGRSVPWAKVELELEQLPQGPPGGAANRYRDVWTITRLRGLGRNPREVPPTREFAHAQALAAAREIDPSFDVAMPSEVNDEVDDWSSPPRRMSFAGSDLRWVRSGNDTRGYWLLEWDHAWQWAVRQYYVANGSGWNQRDRYPLGSCPPGPGLEPFLRRQLTDTDVPADIADDLSRMAGARVSERIPGQLARP